MNCALTETSQPSDHRRGPRTHLFVIATLSSDGGAIPVHIRNMSVRGSLIEAALLPDCGAGVTLKRGSLEISGRIAWKAHRKAGVAFDSIVSVPDWMAKLSNAQQNHVDEIVSALRNSPTIAAVRCEIGTALTGAAMIERELALLQNDLSRLGNALASDVIMVATHPEIQVLDISLQRIERIRKELRILS